MTTRRKFTFGAAAVCAAAGGMASGGCVFMRSERFGRLPEGDRLKRILAAPNYIGGAFRNERSAYIIPARKDDGRGGVWSALFRKKALRLVPKPGEVPVVKTDLRGLVSDRDLFIWFGHSSCLLQTNGLRVLVDPVFHAASPVSFLLGEPFPGTDIYKPEDIPNVDILLITHDHWDHLDYRTVTALADRIGRVICPLGVGEHFERWGFALDKIVEMYWHESAEVECRGVRFVFRCLPSRHFSGRTFKRNQSLWASFLVESPSRKVYFAGDGGYDERFRRIGARFPGIDLAVLENGQYNVRWPMVHTMPDELGMAMHDLGARRYVTVHHGKFCISTHPWDEPFENERKAAAAVAVELLAPKIGEVTML